MPVRISTGMLNDMLAYATARVQPPSDKGKRLRLYYITQASTKPPAFVIFCNSLELFHFSYQRYLENQIRETFRSGRYPDPHHSPGAGQGQQVMQAVRKEG